MAKRLFLFLLILVGASITTWAEDVLVSEQFAQNSQPGPHKLYPYQVDSISKARRKKQPAPTSPIVKPDAHLQGQPEPSKAVITPNPTIKSSEHSRSNYSVETVIHPVSATLSLQQPDSLTRLHLQFQRDSIKALEDILTMGWLKLPDPNRPNLFLDSLVKLHTLEGMQLEAWANRFPKVNAALERNLEGKVRPKRELWVIGTIFGLVVFFALIRIVFAKHLSEVMLLFYSNRSLLKKNKDENLFNSWVFLFLYILFGLTLGMYIYLFGNAVNNQFMDKGFQWFLALSGIVLGLFMVKILLLRLLAFLFDIHRPINEHIATLYLFFSNIAIIFLPIVIVLSLISFSLVKYLSYVTLFLLVLLFVFQLIRAFFRILFGYQFSIAYLFIYLCVLEICPVIILIKVLGF